MEKKTKKKGPMPVHVVRRGGVSASIWMRITQTGLLYYDMSFSRSWKAASTDKEGYSRNFFPQNAIALTEVIEEASAWITEKTTINTDGQATKDAA